MNAFAPLLAALAVTQAAPPEAAQPGAAAERSAPAKEPAAASVGAAAPSPAVVSTTAPSPRPAPPARAGGEGGPKRTATPTATATATPTPTATATSANFPGRGFVSIVGAGPGDPGLLTRRGAERLAEADLVLYDALVDAEVLRLAPRAHCFHVGKRAGRPSISQRAIERLLVRGARGGKRVVRLKCGDPFVLGRGGEEALALAAAGVPFEIVPGVSSAIAAPELAGIPVTHRGLSASFAVVSGHAEAAFGPVLDGLAPGALTVVVLMGLARRAEIAARLLARGWGAETPAAVVLGAGSDAAHAWRGTLAALGEAALPAGRAHLPGVLVVGAVAALAAAPAADRAPALLRTTP
jgi:uroporphyrin-III C-methyltransferase